LNAFSLNIQSLSSKFEELKIFLDRIENSGGNVSVLVEIWDVSILNLFFIKDFELFTNTRETSKGGGVAIYCKRDFNPKLIPGLVRQKTFPFESIAIEISLENVSVLIGSIITDLTNISVSIIHQINLNHFLTSYYLF